MDKEKELDFSVEFYCYKDGTGKSQLNNASISDFCIALGCFTEYFIKDHTEDEKIAIKMALVNTIFKAE